MNSIWLILLLLFCCNNDNRESRTGGGSCAGGGSCTGGCMEPRRTDCGCERYDNDRDNDCDMRMSPFSPLNRRERADADYEAFRGNHGPCGCEENND